MSLKTKLTMIIPGNPGDAYYYQGFAKCLRALGHEVVVFDHARIGQSPSHMRPYAEHQAARLREYLTQSHRSLDDVELFVVGHSIGGYITHLIEKHELLPISRAVLLFPFLARPSRDAHVALAVWRVLGAPLVTAVRSVPRAWQQALLRRAGLDAHSEHLLSTINGEHAMSYPAMGATELVEVAGHVDAGYLWRESPLAQQGRMACIFTDNDRWSPVNEHPDLASIGYHLTQRVSHAFVLHEHSWTTVANAVHSLLTPETTTTSHLRPTVPRRAR